MNPNPTANTSSRRGVVLMEYIILAFTIAAAVVLATQQFGDAILQQFDLATTTMVGETDGGGEAQTGGPSAALGDNWNFPGTWPEEESWISQQGAGTPVAPEIVGASGEPSRLAQALEWMNGGMEWLNGVINWPQRQLELIDNGELKPDPNSRLGAYAATTGYPPGTVGNAVHNAIGTIYIVFGDWFEEEIGTVFNSPEAMALYNEPVDGPASLQIAQLEWDYWRSVGITPGGLLGSAFLPGVRDWLQRKVFSDE